MNTRFTSVSFGLAMAAAIFLLVTPAYSGFEGDRATHATLAEVNGSWVIIPVMFPVFIASLPLILRKQAVRLVATLLIGGFALISGFSIGLFYLPAAIAMLLATCMTPSAKISDVRQ